MHSILFESVENPYRTKIWALWYQRGELHVNHFRYAWNVLGNYFCALQDCTTFALMRVMFMSKCWRYSRMWHCLCTLMLIKQTSQEILCVGIS